MTISTVKPTVPKKRQLSEKQKRTKRQRNGVRYAVHGAALIVVAILYYRFYTYYWYPDELDGLTRFTGKTGIIFLLISLTVTPLNTVFGWNQLLPSRRPLGLYAFFFICIHLLLFIVPIYQFNPREVLVELFKRRYALAGMGAFLIMLPLAITSHPYFLKRMKRNWKRLHKWVYLSGILALVHYVWLSKQTYAKPIAVGVVLAIVLLLRVTPVKKQVIQWRRNFQKSRKLKRV